MNEVLNTLDPTRLFIALKTCLAVIVGYYVMLVLEWQTAWCAITIIVCQTDALGATLKKGVLYFIGTASGAVVGVSMVGLFAHDRELFTVAMAVAAGFILYCMQGSRYPYMWLIVFVTVFLTGWLPAQATFATFDIAVSRSSSVVVGIIVAFLIHGMLWPINAGDTFERRLLGFLEGGRKLLSFTRRTMAGEVPDAAAGRHIITAQVKMLAALRGSLEAAVADTVRFERFHAGYHELIDQLQELLLAIVVLHDGLAARTEGKVERSPPTESAELLANLQAVEGQMEALIGDLARPRDGSSMDREPDAYAGPVTGRPGTNATAYDAMIAGEVDAIASRLTQVRALLARVEDPRKTTAPLPPPAHEPFSLTGRRFRKAVGGGLVVVLVVTVFSLTQWPLGLQLGMIFASLGIGFNGMMPTNMIVRRPLLLALVIGPAIAAPMYLGVMPRIDRFVELIPWLCIAIVPLLYIQTSRDPRTTMMMIFSLIYLFAMMSIDNERQSYSFSHFVTTWWGFAGGFGISLAIFSLFSTLVPEREFSNHVRSFFASCGQFMQELGERAPGTPAGAAANSARAARWPGVLKQLQFSSSGIDYERVPGNDRHKTQALIESIERLALRLSSAERVHQQSLEALDGPLPKLLGRFRDACAESFRLIANALADRKPIPDLPDTTSLLREIESLGADLGRSATGDEDARASVLRLMSATAQLRPLAETIHDCRDKANALDWQAWNRNHF